MGDKTGQTKIIGVIQCDFARERCSGFGCMNSFTRRIDAFARYAKDAGVMLVPFNCGGCPGRRISRVAANLIKRAKKKAEVDKEEIVIHLASCIVTDNGHYPPCPHIDYIEKILKRKGLKVRKGSYRSNTASRRRAEGIYEQFDWDGE
ncbi:MAG: CGGC domain-containing protein [Deltaproteobacteria bacterium]|nr:CGGC domain-containing protein [Deltaproteobacteria bacterium]